MNRCLSLQLTLRLAAKKNRVDMEQEVNDGCCI
jgi:hypothetical protein